MASAYEATEEDFVRWENAWDQLIPAGTYDFVPKDFGYELLFNPNFQSQLDAAGKVIDPSLEGTTIELAGLWFQSKSKVTRFLNSCWYLKPDNAFMSPASNESNAPR